MNKNQELRMGDELLFINELESIDPCLPVDRSPQARDDKDLSIKSR